MLSSSYKVVANTVNVATNKVVNCIGMTLLAEEAGAVAAGGGMVLVKTTTGVL